MNFPTAKERRQDDFICDSHPMGDYFKSGAEFFVELTVLPEVMKTKHYCVNIALPRIAYRDLDKFVEECKKIIPNDYIVRRSHDGCGMYDTLFVSWENKKLL